MPRNEEIPSGIGVAWDPMWHIPSSRPALGAALLSPTPLDWVERRSPIGATAYATLYIADDAAYCSGVWLRYARQRTLGPPLPCHYRRAPVQPRPKDRPGDETTGRNR